MEARSLVSPQTHRALDRIRSFDSAVSRSSIHHLVLGFLSYLCLMYSVFVSAQIHEWSIKALAWGSWWFGLLLVPLLAGGLFFTLMMFGVWLFSLPFVNLIAAVVWVSADVFLLLTLPFFIAELQGEPFRQWAWWLQLILPAVCMALQAILLGALALFVGEFESADADRKATGAA